MDNETEEILKIDTRYESFRLPNSSQERRLIESISDRGIDTPLYGVKNDHIFILLDGFKRLRAAKKLGINIVPIKELGTSEKNGIIELLRIANAKSLHILEQVKLVNELYTTHQMTVRSIGQKLEKSTGWVSTRIGIDNELSKKVWDAVFAGKLPATSAIYTLRQFKRLNKESKSNIDDFVDAVSGKKLVHRDIELLANGWFNGNEEMRKQIKSGDLGWTIENLKKINSSDDDKSLSENEKRVLKDLEVTQKYMIRVINRLPYVQGYSSQYKTKVLFFANGILEKEKKLTEVLLKIKGGEDDRS
jgi:ParB-like chromosome segregation protein Spo0J